MVKPLLAPEGFWIDNNDSFHAYWYFFIERMFDHPWWIEPLGRTRNPLVLDIGANCGLFGELVLSVNPSAKLHYFEPQPDLVRYLQTHVVGTVHPVAVDNHSGKRQMFFSPRMQLSSFWGGMYPADEELLTYPVEVITLDEYCQGMQPFLIKIDAEGLDQAVVEGGRDICNHTPLLIIECLTPDILHNISGLLPEHRIIRLTPLDYLFERKK